MLGSWAVPEQQAKNFIEWSDEEEVVIQAQHLNAEIHNHIDGHHAIVKRKM